MSDNVDKKYDWKNENQVVKINNLFDITCFNFSILSDTRKLSFQNYDVMC